jgi:hypothetical protein
MDTQKTAAISLVSTRSELSGWRTNPGIRLWLERRISFGNVFDYGTAGADYFLFEVLEVQP